MNYEKLNLKCDFIMNEKFIGFKCKKCGQLTFPKRLRCLKCKSLEFEEIDLTNKKATLLTFTKLYAVPEGVTQVPLVLGIVEFENGSRATGQILSSEPEIGMQLKTNYGFLRKLPVSQGGKEVFGFRFEPA